MSVISSYIAKILPASMAGRCMTGFPKVSLGGARCSSLGSFGPTLLRVADFLQATSAIPTSNCPAFQGLTSTSREAKRRKPCASAQGQQLSSQVSRKSLEEANTPPWAFGILSSPQHKTANTEIDYIPWSTKVEAPIILPGLSIQFNTQHTKF